MKPLLSWCWYLSCFRADPKQLPHSYAILLALMALSLFVFILSLVGHVAWSTAVSVTIYIIASQMALIYLILAAAQKQERFIKTMSAILLASLWFQCLSFPGILLIYQVQNISPVVILLIETVIMFIQVWLMFVHAYIINCAIHVGQLVAFLIVFLMSMVQLRFLDFFINL